MTQPKPAVMSVVKLPFMDSVTSAPKVCVSSAMSARSAGVYSGKTIASLSRSGRREPIEAEPPPVERARADARARMGGQRADGAGEFVLRREGARVRRVDEFAVQRRLPKDRCGALERCAA